MRRNVELLWLRVLPVLAAGLALAACAAGAPTVDVEEVLETEPPSATDTAPAAPSPSPEPTATHTATPAPTATETPVAEFDDEIGDTVNCATGAAVDVPAVDIQHITVWNAPEGGYLIDITLGERADETIETVFSFAINLTAETATGPSLLRGFRFGIHDGSRIQGEFAQEGRGEVIENTQQLTLLAPETGMPRFIVPAETQSFRVEAFYKATADAADPVICDPIKEAQDYIIKY